MKKLIVLSVIFALVASAAFAVDLSANVIGTVIPFQSDTGDDAKVTADASMNRIRIEGSGEVADGKFGGYFRAHQDAFWGNAWWKPIDQLKLLIGSNGGDGFFGKEGVTGWMFYQTVADTGVVTNGNTWGGGYSQWPYIFRTAFYGGDGGGDAFRLMITPLDMLAINLSIPFFNGGETAEVFKYTQAQIDLNLDFGNIAFSYVGNKGEGTDQPQVFVYFGGSFGDLALDVGFGYKFANEDETANPMGIGLGLKYATDAFGIKVRLLANMAGENKDTNIVADLLPFFPLGDRLTAFVSVGLAMLMPDEGDTLMDWHFNPYLQVGEEWGAKFLFGIRVWSEGGSDGIVKWAVPLAISVGF